ncbi:MAG: MgtC/SapB family protein [Microbacterium sp.]
MDAATVELVIRILVGTVLGAAIGLERQWRSRMAGIRTNTLVASGSALFVVLGAYSFGDAVTADPTRVAAQVVSGIGFLGAGVIMREGVNVRGLNTAATLWCSAAVGSLAGAGLYVIAAAGALVVVATNTVLRPVSRAIHRRRDSAHAESADDYLFEVTASEKSEQIVRGMLMQSIANADFTLRALTASNSRNESVTLRAELGASAGARVDVLERIAQRLSLDPKVRSVRWWHDTDDEDDQ